MLNEILHPNKFKKNFLFLFFVQLNAFSQNQLSVPFPVGFIGVQNGVTKADGIKTFATLGIAKAFFMQDSSSSTAFVVSNNDVLGTLRLQLNSGQLIDIPGAVQWKNSGGTTNYLGFIPSSSFSIVSFSYGASLTFTISSTSNIGLGLIGGSTSDFVDNTNVSGNNSGFAAELNNYLSTTNLSANKPAGPVAVTALTTTDTTPTITGTVTLISGESLSVDVNNVVYIVPTIAIDGTAWSLPISSALALGTYSVVAKITNSAGYTLNDVTGNELIINALPPVVVTSSGISNSNSITVYGNVSSDNSSPVTERGFVYSVTTNPTTSNTKVVSGSGLGTFSGSISGLSAGTTYYVRAYATNSGGTSYGSELSFTTSISETTTICNGSNTTLTLSGGNLSAETVDVWYEGACVGPAFHEGWDTQPTSTLQTTINSNLTGILNVTSTGVDPQINMFNRGSFDPAVYKFINFRYRVVSGTAGAAQFFFLNGVDSLPDGSKYINETLISDNQWHTVSVDMSANPLWTTGGPITGIRYDYATGSGATLDLDFIELSAAAVVGTGSSITVSPTATTTYYVNRKGYNVNTSCVSQTITVNPLPAAPTATAIQRFCPSDTVASLQATVAAGETLEWYANATGGSALAAATTLSPGNYYAQASSALGCPSTRTLVIVSFNNALYFDGVNDYVSLTSNSIPDGATEFTIEAWIKPDDLNFDGLFHAVFGNQTGGDANTRNPSFYLYQGGIHLDSYEDNTLTRYALLSPAAEILQNVWSHIALVKQANLFYVYINGQLSFTASAPNAINITGPYQFGYIDNYFAGKMDEIRFWSVARTASEIATNMNQFLSGTETGLVDYYTFDQGIQNASNVGLTTLYDNTAATNNGTLNNFALTGSTSNYVPGYFAQIVGTSTIQLGTNSQLNHVILGGSWTSSNTNIATVSNSGLVTSVAVGSAIVNYTSCGQTTTVTITVIATPPTISNFANVNKMYFDGSYSIVAPTSNSLGAFSYTSSNTAVATISGTTVTILSAGTSTITANQASNASYASGSITATLTVSSVSVLTNTGAISSTNLNYVNKYGQIGGSDAVNKYGKSIQTKTYDLTNGLVMHLDAGNAASYPGTGTIWTDLSGFGNNGTLVSGPTYNSSNSGYLVFNGTTTYVDAPLTKTASCTFSVWAKSTSAPSRMLFNAGNDGTGPDLLFHIGVLSWNTWDSSANPFGSIPATALNGNWHNYVVVNDAVSNITKLYYDGVLYGTAGYVNASATTALYIGGSSSGYRWNGAIGVFQVHNRVLTPSDVLENFNNLKTRYGL